MIKKIKKDFEGGGNMVFRWAENTNLLKIQTNQRENLPEIS